MGQTSKSIAATRKEIRQKAKRMARAFKPLHKRNLIYTRAWFGKDARTSGRVVWKGPSQLDPSKNIRVVLSNYVRPSENIKTGPMGNLSIFTDQEWEAMAPEICGNCPHGKNATSEGKKEACYVQWDRIKAAWKASHRNEELTLGQAGKLCKGLKLRFGVAGDPMAVPIYVWQELLKNAVAVTGYTHQWYRTLDPNCASQFRGYEAFLMASVDSPEQAEIASMHGWKWFGVQSSSDQIWNETATPCKALPVSEGGKDRACIQCMLCGPLGKKDIVIPAHGPGKGNVKPLTIEELIQASQ